MINKLIVILSVQFIALGSFGQNFELKNADTTKLKVVERVMDYSESLGYLYLKDNYKMTSDRDSIEYYDWLPEKEICAYSQAFENGIRYSVRQCREAGGITEKIILPKIETSKLKSFIELLFWDESNTWTTELKYEPDGAGCYYEIIQTESNSIIDIYCGC